MKVELYDWAIPESAEEEHYNLHRTISKAIKIYRRFDTPARRETLRVDHPRIEKVHHLTQTHSVDELGPYFRESQVELPVGISVNTSLYLRDGALEYDDPIELTTRLAEWARDRKFFVVHGIEPIGFDVSAYHNTSGVNVTMHRIDGFSTSDNSPRTIINFTTSTARDGFDDARPVPVPRSAHQFAYEYSNMRRCDDLMTQALMTVLG